MSGEDGERPAVPLDLAARVLAMAKKAAEEQKAPGAAGGDERANDAAGKEAIAQESGPDESPAGRKGRDRKPPTESPHHRMAAHAVVRGTRQDVVHQAVKEGHGGAGERKRGFRFPAFKNLAGLLARPGRGRALGNVQATIGSINAKIADDLMLLEELKGQHDAIKDDLAKATTERESLRRELADHKGKAAREIARLTKLNATVEQQIARFREEEARKEKRATETMERLTRDLETERDRTAKSETVAF